MLDHFDLLAPFYDLVMRYSNAGTMASRAALPIDGYLLDAGGGTGRVAEPLRGLAGHIVVADLSMGMLREAGAKGLQAACAPTERLPFPDAAFDRVIMVDALHHVCDQGGTARELWRVLRPDGRIVIVEPDIRRFVVKIIAFFEKLALMRSHFLSAAQILNLFSAFGASAEVGEDRFSVWIILDKITPSLRPTPPRN